MLENYDAGTLENAVFTSQFICKFEEIEDKLVSYIKMNSQKYKRENCGTLWKILRTKFLK